MKSSSNASLDTGKAWSRLGSNALANVFTGGSAMAFQLLLTFIAASAFEPATFAAWTLAVSMAGLVPLFAFNLSAVVTRKLVEAKKVDGAETASVMRAAQRLSWVLAAIALTIIVLAAVPLRLHSPELRGLTIIEFTMTVLVLTLSQLWQITLHPTLGWFYASERNWPAVGVYLLTRGMALVTLAVATALVPGSLLGAALGLAAGHWIGIVAARTTTLRAPTAALPVGWPTGTQLRDMVLLLRWFAIWSLCMAANQYALPQIISLLGSPGYNAFYLAFTLNLVVSGIVGAMSSALLAPVARLCAAGDHAGLARVLCAVPAMMAMGLLLALAILHWGMPAIVTYWSRGLATDAAVNGYLSLLGLQTLARSLSGVFGIVLASRATALRLVGPPLVELALLLVVGLPVGVALGEQAFLLTLTGAGLVAALVTVRIAVGLGGLDAAERRRVWIRFLVIEATALMSWWLLCNW